MDIRVFAFYLFNQKVCYNLWVERCAAREYVCCRVAIFRPSMDGNMGLGDGQNTCNSLGVEPVERLTNNMGSYGFGGFQHCFTNVVNIIQECGVALPKLQ